MLRSRMTMNWATQQTTSSHLDGELRSLSTDGVTLDVWLAVSTLICAYLPAIGGVDGWEGEPPGTGPTTGARPMRRTTLTAMLTLIAVLASTLAVAGCGGKSGNSSSSKSSTTTTTTHK